MDRNGVKNSLLGTQKWDLVPSSGSAKEAAAQTSGLAISQPANITETVPSDLSSVSRPVN